MNSTNSQGPLSGADKVLAFLELCPTRMTRLEIQRAIGIAASALELALAALEREGKIESEKRIGPFQVREYWSKNGGAS